MKECWTKTTIGKCCKVTSSKRFHLSERTSTGIPFYCSKEIIQKVKGEEITESDYISEKLYDDIAKKFGVPQEGDLLITTRGTLGVPYLYKKNDCFYFADGNLTWFKDFARNVVSKFLYYWIQTHEGQKKIDAIAKGTAQKAVPIVAIKDISLALPPIKEQRRIADILSAYDDLIENNRKQIKLMEEAAQRLYKEWFIDLHFPGYEHTKVINGIPEGWKRGKAEDFFAITIGKTPPRAESQWFTVPPEGKHWLSIADMGGGDVYALSTSENLTDEAIQRHHVKVVPVGTVLLSFKLTVGRVSIAGIPLCTNEAIAHFYISEDVQREYLYCYLKNYNYDSLGSTSSISKAINSSIIKAMPMEIPNQQLLIAFSKRTSSLFIQMLAKQQNNRNLVMARDLLLPKLMNGGSHS